MMKSNFIKCGMIGWCLEVAWTGLGSLLRHDPKLTGVSSLTMFPIYGMASLVAPCVPPSAKIPVLHPRAHLYDRYFYGGIRHWPDPAAV